MTKKDIQAVMLKLMDDVGPLLSGSDLEKSAIQILIAESFAPLVEKLKGGKPSIAFTQIGQAGYRIEKVTNLLDYRCGVMLQLSDLEELKENGINVSIARNK